MQRIGVYPGSFDPLTAGHLDIIERSAAVVDTLIVGIAHNASKTGRYLLSCEQRVAAARAATAHLDFVRVEVVESLVAEFCQQVGADVLIKGLRHAGDLQAEAPMAVLNRDLGGPETVYLLSSPSVQHISSSVVKEIAAYGGTVEGLIPAPVASYLAAALADRNRKDTE